MSSPGLSVEYWRAIRGGAEFFFLISGGADTFPVQVLMLRDGGEPEHLLLEVEVKCDDGGFANLAVSLPEELLETARALRLATDGTVLGEFPVSRDGS